MESGRESAAFVLGCKKWSCCDSQKTDVLEQQSYRQKQAMLEALFAWQKHQIYLESLLHIKKNDSIFKDAFLHTSHIKITKRIFKSSKTFFYLFAEKVTMIIIFS